MTWEAIISLIVAGIMTLSIMISLILRSFNKKNRLIDNLKAEKNKNLTDIEKEFEEHLKESGGINNEKFYTMEKKVAILEEKVGNIGKNLDEFQEETKHNFEAVFYKIDKIFENQNSMSKDVATLTEAVKSLRNGK